MSSRKTSSKQISGPSADEVRMRLQRAYMTMIRSYLRRHEQAALTPAASTKGARDV